MDGGAGSPSLRCPICAYEPLEPFRLRPDRADLCPGCGLVQSRPITDPEAIVRHYERQDPLPAVARSRLLLWEKFLDRIERRLGRQGVLLDVGCGRGDFLEIAERRGWRTFGIEPAPQLVRRAREKGLKVYAGELRRLEGVSFQADLITYWDVLMLVEDPVAEIRCALGHLREGGTLFLRLRQHAVVRMMSRLWRLGGGAFARRDPLVIHPINFTPTAVRTLFDRLGVRVEIRPARLTAGDPYGLARSSRVAGLLKFAIDHAGRVAGAVSGNRLLLAPSMEVWAVRPRLPCDMSDEAGPS